MIESNDTTTPAGQFEVLSCAHVCLYMYLNLLFLKALVVVTMFFTSKDGPLHLDWPLSTGAFFAYLLL